MLTRHPFSLEQGGYRMRPPVWSPPIELSEAERTIIKRIRRAKLFIFLRQYRHELFCEAFQQELATLYQRSPQGQPPVAPAQLALATILQAYTQVSDDEVIEATLMDRRWQLVLNCLDSERAPFSKGTLVAFRQRLIATQMDRRLLERTVEVAAASGAFGSRQLRAALDSSPLWGAGRVEDTYNLLGHALRKALGVIARQQGRGLAAVAKEAGASAVAHSSLKAALDLDWDDPQAQTQALHQVLHVLESFEHWLITHAPPPEAAQQVEASMAVAHQVWAQDVSQAADGSPCLRQGVAKDRRIRVEDAEMRHGRKSRSVLVDGYKRHVLRDVDSRLIVAVGITPANAPEASVTDALEADLAAQPCSLKELHIDRAYLASPLVRHRSEELAIFCKAWPVRQGPYFAKNAFALDWQRKARRCPGGQSMPFEPGGVVKFPAAACMSCACRERCTKSTSGRRVSIHPDEALMQELRERQQTPEGRAKLRERVAVEHALSHVGRWQGRRARYRGVRKNVFDLRRCAVVHNLHVLMRLPETERLAA
jgi:transposase